MDNNMKTCPECQCQLVEKRGVYICTALIENASWSYCPVCGLEVLPKSLKKAIKRAKHETQPETRR